MKKIIYFILLLLLVYNAKAQHVSFRSNGHVNNFTKIDTLFFTEYAGKKPSTKTAAIDTAFSRSLMQFDSSFGFTTKTLAEAAVDSSKLSNFKKIFSTPFYAYADGALEAPTSVLFFKPKNDNTVTKDFSRFGKVVKHPSLDGYYYLYLKTNIYNNGDKIFALCDSLNNAGLTITIEPVFVRRLKLDTDPDLPNEWNITNTGQYNGTAGADMKVANVWNMGYTGTGVKVAVIDLGVDLAHPDLQANLLPGYDATGNNSGGAPIYDQYNTHGTECAGIIGEIANNIGGAGVANNAHIIPIRLGIADQNGNFTFSDAQVVNCFNYAVNNGADIISNSWGSHGGSSSDQLNAAISNAITNGRGGKGSIVLFAAGNENSNIDYPASNTNVIAVGASCECDTRKRSSNNPALLNPGVSADPLDVSCDGEYWWGSNFGTGLDVMAPGVDITTTTFTMNPDGTHADTYVNNFNGTSAATPNTAAVLALMLSANPNLTGQQARNILESNTDKVGGYTYQSNISGQPNGTWSTDAGYGRINACAAVTAALVSNGTLSISGNNSFCSSANYTIPNLPTGATVTWSVSPGSIVSMTNGNTPQVTVNTINSGVFNLTANVTTCGTTFAITKNNIRAGVDWSGDVWTSADQSLILQSWAEPDYNYICENTDVYFHIDGANSASQYSYQSGTLSNTPYFDGWYMDFHMDPGSNATFAVTVTSGTCTQTLHFSFLAMECGYLNYYSVAPNPAGSDLSIYVDDEKLKKQKIAKSSDQVIQQVIILDKLGNALLQQKYPADTRKVTMNVSGLSPDMYVAKIFNGKKWVAIKFLKK